MNFQKLLSTVKHHFDVLKEQSETEPLCVIDSSYSLWFIITYCLISDCNVTKAVKTADMHGVNDWDWLALCFADPIDDEVFIDLPNNELNSYVCKNRCGDIGKLTKFVNMKLFTHHLNNNFIILINSICKHKNEMLFKLVLEKVHSVSRNAVLIVNTVIEHDFAAGLQYLYSYLNNYKHLKQNILSNVVNKVIENDSLNCLKFCTQNNLITSYSKVFKTACTEYAWNCVTYLFEHGNIRPTFDVYSVLARDRYVGLFHKMGKRDRGRGNFEYLYEKSAGYAIIQNQLLFVKYIFIEQGVYITEDHLIDSLRYKHLDIFKMLYIHIKEHPESPHDDVDDVRFLMFILDNDYIEALIFLCENGEPCDWIKLYASSRNAIKCIEWLQNKY